MVLVLLPQVHRPVCEDPVLARLLLQLRPPLLAAPPPALLQLLVGRRGPGRHRGQEGGAAASSQRVEHLLYHHDEIHDKNFQNIVKSVWSHKTKNKPG